MIRALGAAAAFCLLALSCLSPASAQTTNRYAPLDWQDEPAVDTSWYGSLGFAWSGEIGLELELGGRMKIGNALELRFAPVNLSVFDGDPIYGEHYFPDEDDDCDSDDFDDGFYISAFCDYEVDAEWRSVAEAQLNLSPTFSLGAGVSYLLQGDFKPEDGRVSPFLSLSQQVDEATALELRASSEYVALRIAGKW